MRQVLCPSSIVEPQATPAALLNRPNAHGLTPLHMACGAAQLLAMSPATRKHDSGDSSGSGSGGGDGGSGSGGDGGALGSEEAFWSGLNAAAARGVAPEHCLSAREQIIRYLTNRDRYLLMCRVLYPCPCLVPLALCLPRCGCLRHICCCSNSTNRITVINR